MILGNKREFAKMCSQDGPCPASCMQTPFLLKYLSGLSVQKEVFLPHSFLYLEVYLRVSWSSAKGSVPRTPVNRFYKAELSYKLSY